ncbi:fibronectin-like [Engraulis encrasicolus]|uniref:fibronectin-like n=1 Tax=Engraulis encrasicolus TaxID=184585 RepID=UPI002FD343CE
MPGEILCGTCPKKAFKSCLTCMASFCGDHVKLHYTTPALGIHRLVEPTGDLEQRLCQQHNRELELYCNTDQIAICVLCVGKGHRGHYIIDLEDHQQMRQSDRTTDVPSPGPIDFISVKPDSLSLCWGPPEGLTKPPKFRVSWMGGGKEERMEVPGLGITIQSLSPGEKYTFTVATVEEGRQSPCVSATEHTDIPPPENLNVRLDLPSAAVSWSEPAGVGHLSYMLNLYSDGKCVDTVSGTFLEYSYPELVIGREYIITVSTVLNGRQSKAVSRTFQTNIPVPERVCVGSVTPTSADLSWSVQGMQQIPHRFRISYWCEGTEPWTMYAALPTTTLTDLQPDTQYTISVCCELDNGGESEATLGSIKTGDFVPDGLLVDALDEETPRNVPRDANVYNNYTIYNGTAYGSDGRWKAEVRWSQLQGLQHIPHKFLICCSSEEDGQMRTSTESCSITLQDLQSDTQYEVTVRCELQGGKKSKMATTTFHTSERRIVLLGKTGDGKSSVGNSILEEEVFTVDSSQHGVTHQCLSHSKIINGRKYTVIDTPGFFDSGIAEDSLIPEIVKCIFHSAPGPHAFVIVLRVGRHTEHEHQTMDKIRNIFSDDAFKHGVLLFTHGEDLGEKTIQEFVSEEQGTQRRGTTLHDLVEKCHDNYHVIDNKHWTQEGGDKSKKTQVANLLNTIEQMVEYNRADGADYYTNEIMVLVELAIQDEMQKIRQTEQNQQHQLTESDIRKRAKKIVERRIMINKNVVTAVVMLLGLVYLPAIPKEKIRETIQIASATANNPFQAIEKALKKLNDLRPSVLSLFRGHFRQYQQMD